MCAPAFTDDGVNILTPRRISYRPEAELITFDIPRGIEEFRLALRRLDFSSVAWRITVEEFVGYSSAQNLIDAITISTGEQVSNIYSRANQSDLIPVSGSKQLTAGAIGTLVSANSKRAYLSIRVGDDAITLFAEKNEAGEGVNVIERVQPGEVYNLPTADGIWKGDIFALSEGNTELEYTEFSV